MEDIDAAFHQSINRAMERPQTTVANGNGGPESPQSSTSRITLSGLLNALDGVGAQEGRLLFATTNRYEALDPALKRPGRMDVHVEFKLASQYQAGELFKRFYSPESAAPNKGKSASDEGKNGEDSGYSSPVREKLVDVELPGPPPRKELDPAELALMSEMFKVKVPDREISMASLQGYLMRYKDRPYDAIGWVSEWVKEEKPEKGNVMECTPEPPLQGHTPTPDGRADDDRRNATCSM
jgi:chaperone BCS1